MADVGGTLHLVGVHSRADCMGASIEMRVWGYADEVEAFAGPLNMPPGCEADGQCAAGCPAPDPDCPCAVDGFCTLDCSDLLTDADCDPNCLADGICAPICPAPDVDCVGPTCPADGVCDPACPNDPDCGGGACAVSDGRCDEACDFDPDCWQAGTVSEEFYEGEILTSSGCAMRRPSDGSDRPLWLLLLLLPFMRRSPVGRWRNEG